ncbi:hypothetical protein ACEPAI_9851 [Sanghuangporus weigelae]
MCSTRSSVGSCSFTEQVSSSIISIGGHEILHQTFTCLNEVFTNDSIRVSQTRTNQSVILGSRSSIEGRDEIVCEFPQFMTECQCGVMFDCQCFEGDVAPDVFDCLTLVQSVTSANEGSPTFAVEPNHLQVFTLRTCSLSFVNLQNSVVDYCWDNLNFIGNEAWDRCVSDESDRVVGATCVPANDEYRISLGPVAST